MALDILRPSAPAERLAAVEAPALPFQILALTPTPEGININVTAGGPLRPRPEIKRRYWPLVREAEAKLPFNSPKIHTEITGQKIDPATGQLTLNLEAQLSTYARWFALGRQGMPQEVQDLVRHAGVSINFITVDNMLMFQFRNTANRSYPGWLGAGASGGVDGNISRHNPNNRYIERHANGELNGARSGLVFDNITHATFEGNALKEAQEETTLSKSNSDEGTKGIDKVIALGVARITQKPTDEFIFLGTVNQTSQEIVTQHRSTVEKDGANEHDPIDNVGFIKASPGAIEEFVTKVGSPLNASGLAAMLLTGYYLRFQEVSASQTEEVKDVKKAQETAQAWLDTVSPKAAAHYKSLEAKAATVLGFPTPQLDPHKRPDEQGLMPAEKALEQAGIPYRRDGHIAFGDLYEDLPIAA